MKQSNIENLINRMELIYLQPARSEQELENGQKILARPAVYFEENKKVTRTNLAKKFSYIKQKQKVPLDEVWNTGKKFASSNTWHK